MNDQALWALGSNMGDREGHIRRALEGFDSATDIEVLAWSRIWVTPPVGGPAGQDPYYNLVLKTRYGGRGDAQYGGLIRDLEAAANRVRQEHWGPRTLDVDLLLCPGEIAAENGLTVPHPRMHERVFVMGPAVEIAPDWIHPRFGLRLSDIAAQLKGLGALEYLTVEDWRCPQ